MDVPFYSKSNEAKDQSVAISDAFLNHEPNSRIFCVNFLASQTRFYL